MRTRGSEREQGPVAARTRNRQPAEDISLPPVTRTTRKRASPASQPKSQKRARHTPKQDVTAAQRAAKRKHRSGEASERDEGGPSRPGGNNTHSGKRMSNTSEDAEEQQNQAAQQTEEQERLQGMFGDLGAANSALQGLLRKLGGGAGFEDGMPSSGLSHTRFKSILVALREQDDETSQLAALNELCEMLSISTEESLSIFPVDQAIPVLVNLLNAEHNPDMMLLAARALTFLADVIPASASSIVRHGAVTVLCARLLSIDYIDLAEQSLQALEKLSHEHPQAVLRQGGLMAVLSFLDFFQTSVQRVAVATAAAMCRGLTSDSVGAVSSAVPILTNILQYEDAKVVDHACTALSRIAESYARYPERLDMLCNHGLINNAVQLVAVSESGSMTAQLNVATYYGLIKLLGTCASGSASVAETLLLSELPGTLKRLLETSTLFSSSTTSNASVLRSNDQLQEVVSLIAKILPPVPAADGSQSGTSASATATSEASAAAAAMAAAEAPQGPDRAAPAAAAAKQAADAVKASTEKRVKFLQENAALLDKFSADLLPLLLHVYASTMQQQVRTQVLASITRIVYFSNVEALRVLLADLPISSFVAGLLTSNEPAIVEEAMQLAELLIGKLPDIFHIVFVKEGVVHAIDKLAASVPEDVEPAAAASEAAAPAPPEPSGDRRVAGQSSRRMTRSASKGKAPDDGKEERGSEMTDAKDNTTKPVLAAAEAALVPKAPSKEARVAKLARDFKEKHFSGAGSANVETEGIRHLRQLCSRLSKPGAVAELLAAMQADSNISTFEFLTSGTVHQLKDYLLGKDLNGPKRHRKHLARIQAFSDAALGTGSLGSAPPALALVRKLQAALASVEDLPAPAPSALPASSSYRYYHTYSSSGRGRSAAAGSLTAGLSALAQPFKLRLCKAANAPASLREYSTNVVLIEPLATMAAIEEFLWPRVYRSPAEIAAEEAAAARRAKAAQAALEAAKQASAEEAAAAVAGRDQGGSATGGNAGAAQPARRMTRSASKAQAIPEPAAQPSSRNTPGGAAAAAATLASERRMTRAAARAAAEAGEVPPPPATDAAGGSGSDDGGPQPMDAAFEQHGGDGGGPSSEGRQGSEGSSDHELEDGVMLQDAGDEYGDEEGMQGDEDELMDEDGIVDGASDGDDDAARMGIERMQVHDVLLGDGDSGSDGANSAAAVAAAAAATAAPPTPADRSAPAPAPDASAAPDSAPAAAAPSQPAAAQQPISPPPARAASYAQAAAAGTRAAAEAAAREAGEPLPPEQPKLRFTIGSRHLDSSMSIFQAVQIAREHAQAVEPPVSSDPASLAYMAQRAARRMWDETHALTYQLQADEPEPQQSQPRSDAARPRSPIVYPVKQGGDAGRAALAELLTVPVVSDLGISSTTADLLTVLTLVDSINRSGPHLAAYQGAAHDAAPEGVLLPPGRVARSEFNSNKLAPKLAQQLKDVLAICGGTLPAWCERLVFGSRFLFPFALRRAWFRATALGLPRALAYLQSLAAAEGAASQDADRDDRAARVGRLTRQKVRVSRKRILESATKVMELYANGRALLELEFFGEVGTGLGPTLEFYTLLAHELQRRSLGIWRSEGSGSSDNANDGAAKADNAAIIRADHKEVPMQSDLGDGSKAGSFVHAPQGLFPTPLPPNRGGSRLLPRFTLLGRAAAKALQDGRMLDVPLSYTFWRIALGQSVDLFDVRKVDAGLGATLEKLAAAAGSMTGGRGRSGPLTIDGCPIEDLCLTFVLPGFPEYELRPGGADTPVDASNVGTYVAAVVEATLGAGIARQVAAFKAGFEEVFPLRHLSAFCEDEIEAMLCGTGEKWTVESLADSMKFDHGYSRDSSVIGWLLRVLAGLDGPDQRRFLRFVTGSPRLPPGGLAALQPRLTVVRKHSTASAALGESLGSSLGASLSAGGGGASTAADGDLPSVMTCANYIKLPPYSSFEVTSERIMYAIREGQGSFDLS